jgi:ABC-2 type transport system ATP-binding protein
MGVAKGGEAAIRCEGLSKRFGDIEALKPLDLAVPYGSIFGYLGRNGAGKTTTIRLLTGLARPTTGSATVVGVETTNGERGARYQFGYLPEDPAFYSWMTPGEYLDYVARLFGLAPDARRKRADELLELVELRDAARRRIGGFSAGMFQRLGIAQALIHDPPVLFLDEPTSSLDPAGRHEVLDLLDSLRGQVTVFLSSHILADVERICDTIGILHKGELVLVSGRDELLAKYAVDTALLEIDGASMPVPEQFLVHLREQPWIERVRQDQNRLHITVTDVDHGKRALLPLIGEHGVVLNRYEWARPSLEEIFLRISS